MRMVNVLFFSLMVAEQLAPAYAQVSGIANRQQMHSEDGDLAGKMLGAQSKERAKSQSSVVSEVIAKYNFVVAKNGSGDFSTIQEAVSACRDFAERRYSIFVKRGIYNEKLEIPSWKTHISIIGEDVDSTIITYSDYSGKVGIEGKRLSTFTSFTCKVSGCDILFANITFVNAAGRVGQAVALHVEGDRCVFRNCRIVGNQDTLFASGDNSRQYYLDCYIEGTTDFIFGSATAVFERCVIESKKNSYITAASTLPRQKYGFVFLNCRLIADTSAIRVFLGRPWRLNAYTAFVRCEMGSHIVPEGWHNWNKSEAERTARYFEYKNIGPGADTTKRVAWSHQLSSKDTSSLTAKNILQGIDNWDPGNIAGSE